MAGTTAVSVIVPTRNRAGYLATTLGALAGQVLPGGDYEVVVVDDGSDDPAAAERAIATIRDARWARVELVRQPWAGPNAARNRGLGQASGELLVLVDDDIDAAPGWLAALVDGAARHPEAEVLGGPIEVRLEGRPRRVCGREAPPLSGLDLGPADRAVDAVWSGNMAIRRAAFERIGEFREQAAYGAEEVEWEERLRAQGGTIVYVADARLVHRRDARDSRLPSLCREAYRRGRRLRAHDLTRPGHGGLAAELRTLAGCAYHGIRHRCANGPPLVAAAAGRVVETLAQGGRGGA